MNNETFEQVSLQEELISAPDLLTEGLMVEMLFDANEERVLTCDLPQFIVMEITYSEPGIRGDTATNVSKPATLETGAIINVPIFVNQGEKIKIDTRTKTYVERVRNK